MKFLKNLFRPSTDDSRQSTTEPSTKVMQKKGSQKTSKAKKTKKIEPAKLEPVKDVPEDFAELNLPNALNRAILKLGFTNCTPVQKEVLPHSLDGKDIIAQAQTGTGKTAAFLFSIVTYHLENPETDPRKAGTPYALIIAPTRELVLQIAQDAEQLSEYTNIKVMSVVGGMDYEKQKNQLLSRIDIVVATPGRLLDFLRSRVIDLSSIETLVIDEADRMLSMGFIPDVKAIIGRTPRKENRQTQLFSATFSEDIKRLAATWTLDPVRIEIEPTQLAVDSVKQIVYLSSTDTKFNVLCNLVKQENVGRVIVFVNRRDETRYIENKLYRQGIDCGLLSGEIAQKKRIRTLDEFKSGVIQVLVATDVAGRGIHVDNVTHVVNYNLPEDPEDYVHRIGRTGRAGADGTSITLACEDDAFMIPSIEEMLGQPLDCQQPPEELLAELPPPVRKSRDKPPVQQKRHSR